MYWRPGRSHNPGRPTRSPGTRNRPIFEAARKGLGKALPPGIIIEAPRRSPPADGGHGSSPTPCPPGPPTPHGLWTTRGALDSTGTLLSRWIKTIPGGDERAPSSHRDPLPWLVVRL